MNQHTVNMLNAIPSEELGELVKSYTAHVSEESHTSAELYAINITMADLLTLRGMMGDQQ